VTDRRYRVAREAAAPAVVPGAAAGSGAVAGEGAG
jgi:hypothetical protein